MYSHVCGRATNAGCSAGKREINDGSQFALARNGNNVVTDEYGFYPGGDQPMSLRLPSGRTGVFITDPQLRGTVRAIADADKNAANQEFKTYTISPWGVVPADTGTTTRLRMAGQQYDQGSRLYFMRARYYDPDLGRFLSEDPIGISGGLNLYAYAGNDPVNKADPTGTSEQCGYAWFEWTYRWIDGPHKGEISRTEYHQQWVCDPVADGPSSEPSEYPAKGGRKPGQEDGKFEGFGGRPRTWDQRLATCANRELLSSGDATAVTVAVGPWVPKQALGQPVLPGASPFTNLVSEARFPAKALGMDTRLSSRALGSNNLFGAAGRFGNYAAVGLLVYQASEVVACMDAGDMAAGGGYSGSGAGGEF